MNQALFVGRLTRPVVVKHLDADTRVVNNQLAVQRLRRNQHGEFMTDFIPISAWGGLADLMEKYCEKGQQIAVNGRMQSRDYDDKTGVRHYVVECVLENITLLSGGKPANRDQSPKEETVEIDSEQVMESLDMTLAED